MKMARMIEDDRKTNSDWPISLRASLGRTRYPLRLVIQPIFAISFFVIC